MKVSQNSSNWFLAFFIPLLLLFGWSRVEIPICQVCKKRFLIQRWGRECLTWMLIIILIWFVMPHFEDWNNLARKVAVGGIVIIGILPAIIFEVLCPRIFNTTAKSDSVEYEFSSYEYALDFHQLNEESIVTSDLDKTDETQTIAKLQR